MWRRGNNSHEEKQFVSYTKFYIFSRLVCLNSGSWGSLAHAYYIVMEGRKSANCFSYEGIITLHSRDTIKSAKSR